MSRTIVIPAAGTGSRLKEHTQNFNKAMCTLGPKPIISYIIEKFSRNDTIIILLGYKGDLLKQVIKACYPDWDIKFVEVDNFEGPGSGLGYSLSRAKDLLQKPFIFWSNDTVIDENPNDFNYDHNWMMLSKFDAEKAYSYRHAKIESGKVCSILAKGSFDESGRTTLPYIGVSFIKDWKAFWKVYDENRELFINAGESAGLNNLNDINYYVTSSWIDTGNKIILEKYKKIYNQRMEETILEKPNEAIWFIDNRVIKFHLDEKFIADRVARFKTFINDKMRKAGFVIPELLSYDKNVYVYRRANGVIASSIINPKLFADLMNGFIQNVETIEAQDKNQKLKDIYEDFYKNKTLKRIEKYCNEYEDLDGVITINGLECMSAKELIKSVKWDEISSKGILTNNYHGDFHLENILYDKDTNQWVMLDWRQNFGKSMTGDLYYDIAKMWHSLIVNHKMVKGDLFNVKYIEKNNVEIDIHRTFIDTECEDTLRYWLNEHDMLELGQFLTALIFLNICGCHDGVYNTFLFYLGKYLMNKFRINHPSWFNC